MLFTDQNHPSRRFELRQAPEGAKRFGDTLVRLQETEGADEGRRFVQAEAVAILHPVSGRDPRSVRDAPHRSRKSGAAHLIDHKLAVYDDATRGVQDTAHHWHAFVIRTY